MIDVHEGLLGGPKYSADSNREPARRPAHESLLSARPLSMGARGGELYGTRTVTHIFPTTAVPALIGDLVTVWLPTEVRRALGGDPAAGELLAQEVWASHFAPVAEKLSDVTSESVRSLLVAVYSKLEAGRVMAALQELSFQLDDWLRDSDVPRVEALLRMADVDRLGISGAMAILTDTRDAAAHLPTRAGLAARSHEMVQRVAPERAAELIALMQ